MWGAGVANAQDGQEYLARVRYGQMPPGYEKLINQADTALTLTPGCYQATVSGTGHTVFDVLPDGSVRERSAPDVRAPTGAA